MRTTLPIAVLLTSALFTELTPLARAQEQMPWVPTDAARKFELMFRAYAPTKALFEKTWVLPDVEKVATQ